MHVVPYPENQQLRTIKRGPLTLFRYVEPLTDPAAGLYRSVIFNEDKLVSFTPPKSMDYAEFSAKHALQDVRVEEFMDGTMVYAYFDDVWRLGTRSVFDANTVYRCGTSVPYFSKTSEVVHHPVPCVRDVFMQKVGGPTFFDSLRPSCVYVFSLMTPQTFNVLKGDGLYLTAVYEIRGQEARLVDGGKLPEVVLYPKKYTFTTYETLAECVDELPYTCKGFMLHSAGGDRTKLVSPAFRHIKNLLDNQPNINRCLLKLMREHREMLFLEVYPEYQPNAKQLLASIKSFTNVLYSDYMECFCAQVKPLREYPPMYKTHMYQLHKLYLTTLRPAQKRVNKQEVVQYVAGLNHAQLSCVLNL